MLIDTHAHLNFNDYKEDSLKVLQRSFNNDVWMINVGSQFNTSKKAVEIAEKYPKGVYAAIGLHPIHLSSGIFKTKIDPEELPSATNGASKEEIEFETREEEFDYEKYRELSKSSKVVAIGEIGLDYYYCPKTKIKLEQFKNKQKEAFLKQLDLARDLNLPVILHCRMAHQDLIEVLNSKFQSNPPGSPLRVQPNSKIRGVVHCFTGTWEQARKYLEMGLSFGFNGIIFKLNLDEVIKKIPLDKILLEPDCPYLTPSPMTGRNEPIYVKYVAEKIAEIKEKSYEEIAKITTENAKKLFRLNL